MSRPVSHSHSQLSSARAPTTNGVAEHAIQSAITAWETPYTMLAEWLEHNQEPAVTSPEHEYWERCHEQLERLVRPFEEALLNTMRASDHQAQENAIERAMSDAERQAREVMTALGGPVQNNRQRDMQTEMQHLRRILNPSLWPLQHGYAEAALHLVRSRFEVAVKLVELLEPFYPGALGHQASHVQSF